MKIIILIASILFMFNAYSEDFPCGYKTTSSMGYYVHPNGNRTMDIFGNLLHPNETKVSISDFHSNPVFSFKISFNTTQKPASFFQIKYHYILNDSIIEYKVEKDGTVSSVTCRTKNWKDFK